MPKKDFENGKKKLLLLLQTSSQLKTKTETLNLEDEVGGRRSGHGLGIKVFGTTFVREMSFVSLSLQKINLFNFLII